MANNHRDFDVPRVTKSIATGDEFFGFILNALASLQRPLSGWLENSFRRLPIATCEDIFQCLQVELIRKGIGSLGVKELVEFQFPATAEVLNAVMETTWKKVVTNFKRQLNHRAIDRTRRRQREILSDELVLEVLGASSSSRISLMECFEELGDLIKWAHEGLSERESIVFKYWLEFQLIEPKPSEIYPMLNEAECMVFGRRKNGQHQCEDPEEFAKRQLSRTLSSLCDKIKRFWS